MALFVAGLAAFVPVAAAQQPLVVRGHLVRQTPERLAPLPGAWVTLHRIGPNAAGAIDSVRTDPSGTFRFHVAAADSASMYLATARHGGIAYFAPPTRVGEAAGESEIVVFDTTTVALPLQVSGRHIVVSAPNAKGAREVVEVYEIQNDTIVTQVAGPDGRPTFVARLPQAARNVRSTQGDFTGAAIRVGEGVAQVLAPIAPGVRQLVLTYDLDAREFPLALDISAPATVLEILLEEADGRAEGDSLRSLGAVSVEGRSFVRFLGRDVAAGAPVRIVVPTRGGSAMPGWLPGVVLGVLSMAALGFVAMRRARPPAIATAVAPTALDLSSRSVDDLRQAIVGVDQVLASATTAAAARPSLESYRAELQRALDRALASQPGQA